MAHSQVQEQLRVGDDDSMEISSDAGRHDDIDIDIDLGGVDAPTPRDQHMNDEDEIGDEDDDMKDEPEQQELAEEEMEDLIEDEDEEIHDADYDDHLPVQQSTGQESSAIHPSTSYPSSPCGIEASIPATALEPAIVHEAHHHGSNEMPTSLAPLLPQDPAQSDHPINDPEVSDISPAASDRTTLPEPRVQATEDNDVQEASVKHDDAPLLVSNHSSPAQTSDLHPCIVTWDGLEMSLFEHVTFPQFLIQDASAAQSSLTHLFSECRKVLSESIDDSLELVFDIPQLELRIREDIVTASTCSIADIVDIYVNLSLNDGIEEPEPLRLLLTLRTKFEARIDELREAATSGRGMSHIAHVYSPNAEEDELGEEQVEAAVVDEHDAEAATDNSRANDVSGQSATDVAQLAHANGEANEEQQQEEEEGGEEVAETSTSLTEGANYTSGESEHESLPNPGSLSGEGKDGPNESSTQAKDKEPVIDSGNTHEVALPESGDVEAEPALAPHAGGDEARDEDADQDASLISAVEEQLEAADQASGENDQTAWNNDADESYEIDYSDDVDDTAAAEEPGQLQDDDEFADDFDNEEVDGDGSAAQTDKSETKHDSQYLDDTEVARGEDHREQLELPEDGNDEDDIGSGDDVEDQTALNGGRLAADLAEQGAGGPEASSTFSQVAGVMTVPEAQLSRKRSFTDDGITEESRDGDQKKARAA